MHHYFENDKQSNVSEERPQTNKRCTGRVSLTKQTQTNPNVIIKSLISFAFSQDAPLRWVGVGVLVFITVLVVAVIVMVVIGWHTAACYTPAP